MTEPATEQEPGVEPGRTYSQADVDRMIGERLARQKAQFGDVDGLKAKAAKLDEIEAKNKTELDKATERATAAEARATAAELRLIRQEVAAAKGLPASMAQRLTGSTKEELEADAAQLAKELGGGQNGGGDPARVVADLRSGALPAGQAASSGGGSDWMRAQRANPAKAPRG